MPEIVMNTCPDDVTQLIDIGSAPQSVTWEHAQAIDNSGFVESPIITMNNGPNTVNSGDLFPLGNTVISYTFCDSAGNCNFECRFEILLLEGKTIRPLITPSPFFTAKECTMPT